MRRLSFYSIVVLLISAWSAEPCFAADSKSVSQKVSRDAIREVFRADREGRRSQAEVLEMAPARLTPRDEMTLHLRAQEMATVRDQLEALARSHPGLDQQLGFQSLLESMAPAAETGLEAAAGSMPLPPPEHDSRIQLHTAALLELQVGANRGAITYPLYRGVIERTNAAAYFVVLDTSDFAFAEEFGVMYSPNLTAVNSGALERVEISTDGVWHFPNDPGVVAREEGGAVRGVLANPTYSPLKRISWGGREVTINAPLVKWGDDPGQQILIDRGGCDPLIRRNPAPNEFRGGGPAGCENDPPDDALARYRGGQALVINVLAPCQDDPPSSCGSITMKLHRAIYREDTYPYLTVFEASKAATAEELGVAYVPRLGALGPSNPNNAVASIIEFQNGVYTPDGGPARFQPGVTSYASQTWSTYSPFLHVVWGFFDCNRDGRFVDAARNVSYADPKGAEAGGADLDPSDPLTFQPFAMAEAGTACPDYVAQVVGRPATTFPVGTVMRDDVAYVADQGALFLTEAPPGWSGRALSDPALRGLDSADLRAVLIINAPSPVTFFAPAAVSVVSK